MPWVKELIWFPWLTETAARGGQAVWRFSLIVGCAFTWFSSRGHFSRSEQRSFWKTIYGGLGSPPTPASNFSLAAWVLWLTCVFTLFNRKYISPQRRGQGVAETEQTQPVGPARYISTAQTIRARFAMLPTINSKRLLYLANEMQKQMKKYTNGKNMIRSFC